MYYQRYVEVADIQTDREQFSLSQIRQMQQGRMAAAQQAAAAAKGAQQTPPPPPYGVPMATQRYGIHGSRAEDHNCLQYAGPDATADAPSIAASDGAGGHGACVWTDAHAGNADG